MFRFYNVSMINLIEQSRWLIWVSWIEETNETSLWRISNVTKKEEVINMTNNKQRFARFYIVFNDPSLICNTTIRVGNLRARLFNCSCNEITNRLQVTLLFPRCAEDSSVSRPWPSNVSCHRCNFISVKTENYSNGEIEDRK